MTDPNPIVASKGIEKLRGAGIDVRVGVEEALCRRLNEAYIHRMITGKAFATFSPVTVEPSGVNVEVLPRMNFESILQLLAQQGLCSVLVDSRNVGGALASLLNNFDEKNLVQKVLVELLPVWMVSEGLSNLAFGGSQPFPLKNVEHKEANGSLLLEGYVQYLNPFLSEDSWPALVNRQSCKLEPAVIWS